MDISHATLQYVESVIDAADMVGVSNIIIEPGRVRGMTDDAEVFILHTHNVPVLEFNAIGINRSSVFRSRYNIVKELKAVYTATTHTIDIENEPFMFVRSIKMQSKKIDLDFRCANPITIRSPKKILELVEYRIDNIDEWLDIMSKGFQSMGENSVLFKLQDGTLSFKLSDENGDVFNYVIADDCEADVLMEADAATEFSFEYHAKVLLPILKKIKGSTIYLTSNGMMQVNVNNFDVFIKPVA